MLVLNCTRKIFPFTCIVLFTWLFVFDAGSTHALRAYAISSNTRSSIQVAQAVERSHSIFRPVLNQLKTKTRVPLKLPAYIPQEDYPLYITVNSATPDRYELTIGADKNCSGGNYCRYGTVSGQRITTSTPSVEEEYAFLSDPSYQPSERSKEKMGRVTLAHGIKGYFIPYVCGANCDDSKVIWEQNGYRYLVGIKSGDKKTVVDMANSAISSRAVSPK